MRVLLLHSENDFQSAWVRGWDLIVDLGRAPKSFYDEWSRKLGCPIFSIFDLAVEVEDFLVWRDLFRLGLGRVVDPYGIDWWDVIGLLLQHEMQDLRLSRRLATKIKTCNNLTVTRHSLIAEALRLELQCPLNVLHTALPRQIVSRFGRYHQVATNLSFRQLRQVVYDKYDPRYIWRRRFTPSATSSSQPVILIPSAYSNVTRTAFRYAQILPTQQFLLVLARETGAISPVPPNVRTEILAAFAQPRSDRKELRHLEDSWDHLQASLRSHPEFALSVQLGILDKGKQWLPWGLAVRDAWNAVFERCSVTSCFCADDLNPYSRIPLLLARQRQLPAIACHHGALDGMMTFKNPAFSTYLVKGNMELDYLERACKVDPALLRIGAASASSSNHSPWSDHAPWIVFFTEPYETDLWRTQPIYREVLPRLCAAARRAGKKVMLKLHPFESLRQRQQMLTQVLNKDDRQLVSITAAPMSQEILQNTWCAVTVESTTAVECATAGIPVFLCGWLRHAYFGYAPQYARFGIARMLESPDDLLKLPDLLEASIPPAGLQERLLQAISPEQLAQILCGSKSATLR